MFNTLAPALMGTDLRKTFETPFGPVTFTHHKPYTNCLWIDMNSRKSDVNVDTYLTATKLGNYGLMFMVRQKANRIGHKQKEYQQIAKVMDYLIEELNLEEFNTNKRYGR